MLSSLTLLLKRKRKKKEKKEARLASQKPHRWGYEVRRRTIHIKGLVPVRI